jgi:8-oxo-dGTP diphosphatase
MDLTSYQRRGCELTMQRTREKRWAICRAGHFHRGVYGGTGLLLRYAPGSRTPVYLLAEQARSLDARAWGIPGGAMKKGETPRVAARRVAAEEIWPVPRYRVTRIVVQDCGGGWQFHIVSADVTEPFFAHPVKETAATGWFTIEQVSALPLLPGIRRWVDERITPTAQ